MAVPPPQPVPPADPAGPGTAVPFGVNAQRLNARQWLIVAALVLAAGLLVPRLWPRVERFDTGPDYRIPYSLSKDYWLWQRWVGEAVAPEPTAIAVLGDSVVWGEYVLPDGTLPHFLNRATGASNRFVNAGVNGLFPLALEGLVRDYSPALHHRKVLLHANVLWMSSPKADLSTPKEEPFNHARLVPQFQPRIPCYRADVNERLSAVLQRQIGFLAWVGHLQNAYFEQKSILQWTLADDGGDPPRYPNVARNPLARITCRVPVAPAIDPQRGPASPRHQPWSATSKTPVGFDWVSLDASLQWQAFQRLVRLLRDRHNDVLVVVGPFNEHLIAPESREGYRALRDGIAAWLRAQGVPCVVPAPLASELYADASHPLTAGYEALAGVLMADESFRGWLLPR